MRRARKVFLSSSFARPTKGYNCIMYPVSCTIIHPVLVYSSIYILSCIQYAVVHLYYKAPTVRNASETVTIRAPYLGRSDPYRGGHHDGAARVGAGPPSPPATP